MALVHSSPVRPVPSMRTAFATHDLDEANDYFTTAYGSRPRIQGSPTGGVIRHVRAGGGEFALDHLELPKHLSYKADPLPTLAVVELRAGTMERQTAGRNERISAGEVMILAEPGSPWTARTWDVQMRCTVLDSDLLAEVAGAAPNGPHPFRFVDFRPASTSEAQRWKNTRRYLDELLSDGEKAAQPLVLSAAARLLAATALTTFRTTTDTADTADIGDTADAADAVDARQTGSDGDTLDRAITFIEANVGRGVGATDIASASHVSLRALQLAFRRHLGTTPMAYMRSVRLDRAHRELAAADPTRDTVTGVATRWGFGHPGRFAAAYRESYGSSPSTTLHT